MYIRKVASRHRNAHCSLDPYAVVSSSGVVVGAQARFWLVKPQWAGSVLGRLTRYEYQVLGSTSIPPRLDTLVYWEPFSWLTSVGTTRNTVIRLGWSRIGLAVLNLHAAGVGLIGRPAVISGRYNKCHSLQLQNHYAHFPPLHHTHIHAKHNRAEPVMGNGYGFRGIVCWPWQEKSCVIG